MPRRDNYVPKHRAARLVIDRLPRTPAAVAGVALCATGLAVSGSAEPGGPPADGSAVATLTSGDVVGADDARAVSPVAEGHDLGRRAEAVSRSLERTAVDPAKERALDQASGGQVTVTEDRTGGDPRKVARLLLPRLGFGQGQFGCLDKIYTNESGWKVHANNPSSSAYGIPQALPGSKMASAGPHWRNDAATQIRWGLGYIKARYGSPCGAWAFKASHGWY